MPTRAKRRGKTRPTLPKRFTARAYNELDGRRAVVKRLKRRADELFSRAERSDAATLERCRRIAFLEMTVQSAEVNAAESGESPGGVYVQQVNMLERLYSELGIEPGEAKTPDLDSYVGMK